MVLALILAGCSIERANRQADAFQPVNRVSMPLPPAPIAVASKKVATAKKPTTGIKNPGAEPGETFSKAEGGKSCDMRWTTKGWIMQCGAPQDGTPEFDIRNPASL